MLKLKTMDFLDLYSLHATPTLRKLVISITPTFGRFALSPSNHYF
jgi:hypothetical protein